MYFYYINSKLLIHSFNTLNLINNSINTIVNLKLSSMKKLLLTLVAGLFVSVAAFSQTHSDISGNKITTSGKGYLYQFAGSLTNQCQPNDLDWFAGSYDWNMGTTAGTIVLSEPAANPDTWVHTKFSHPDCGSPRQTIDLTGGFTIRIKAKSDVAGTVLFATVNSTVSSALAVADETKTQTIANANTYQLLTYTFASTDFATLDPAVIEGLSLSIGGDNATNITIDWITIGDAVSGVDKAIVDNSLISVYPNPAKDQISVNLSAITGQDITVKVVNVYGEVVKEEAASGSIHNLSVANLEKGVYMIQVASGNKVSNKKIVVE
jgi:hypothetical protein